MAFKNSKKKPAVQIQVVLPCIKDKLCPPKNNNCLISSCCNVCNLDHCANRCNYSLLK